MFASYPLEQVRDSFRAALLAALDKAAKQYTGEAKSGWVDSDLPELFRALDSQIERVAERYEIALLEEVTS